MEKLVQQVILSNRAYGCLNRHCMMSYSGDLVKGMREKEWMLLERFFLYFSDIIHHTFLRFIPSN